MMLGASTVRPLASSLLLVKKFSKRSPAVRDLMVLSLIMRHAREQGRDRRFKRGGWSLGPGAPRGCSPRGLDG